MITHFPKDWIKRASAHYCHAVEKHPHFADALLPKAATKELVRTWLAECRQDLRESAKRKHLAALDVLECEIAEAVDAIFFKCRETAIDEIYDAIAVLMRMADMVERRRK